MSPLRILKSKIGVYCGYETIQIDEQNFYQFALEKKSVVKNFQRYKFSLIYSQPINAIKGLKDECYILENLIIRLININNFYSKLTLKIIDETFKYICSHLELMVFQVKK